MYRRFYPLLLLLPLMTGCRKSEPRQVNASSEPPAVQAAVLRVEARPFSAIVAVTGTLISSASVEVKAETTGRVLKFPKEEGDRVSAGEPVLWVDQENHRLNVRQAESAVRVADAALVRAQVSVKHSRTEFERAQNLLKSGGITDKDYKAAELADLDARAQAELMTAQLEQARSAFESAQKRLRDTVVRAPVTGEIQRKIARPGAYVEPPTPVFSLVDNRRLELESPVPTADLAPIRPGQKVAFTVNSYPGETFEGRVIEVNPAVEAETRAAKVRIRVENAAGKLKAGMFAQGEILTGVEAQAIVIPAVAVYRDDHASKQSHVFVVDNGKAARREVRIGREQGSTLEITDGLRPGELLIAEQSIEVAEGVRVAPRGARR
ncbi:MAG TPA: efflux RND transporter periplasmic adaptor subunit [Bryobacteraceae bacterium]|nr:efflux RND transporter periplasmic adaptor subunit [Bryobacteraceae bacterium]